MLPPPILVIGVGNDLRGDDAAGLLVARTVAGWGRPGVRVVERPQLVPELAADIAAAGSLILVDAAVGGPGTVACEPAHPAVEPAHLPLTHGLRLPELLAVAARLGGRAPPAWVVAVPAVRFEVGAGPSPACQAGVEAALWLLADLLPAAHGLP
jgi:hydrogenase maturation protease